MKDAPLVLPEGLPSKQVTAFATWLEARGERSAADRAREIGASSALGVQLTLPGPVGELNQYTLHPRGRILLRPATWEGLLAQIAGVLATGNSASVEGMDLPEGLPRAIVDALGGRPDEPFAACLVEGDARAVSAACERVAALPGPIVPVHAWDARGAGPGCTWLLEEVSISINTTAAGGNASLMMIG